MVALILVTPLYYNAKPPVEQYVEAFEKSEGIQAVGSDPENPIQDTTRPLKATH